VKRKSDKKEKRQNVTATVLKVNNFLIVKIKREPDSRTLGFIRTLKS